jgi:hypothetical protein
VAKGGIPCLCPLTSSLKWGIVLVYHLMGDYEVLGWCGSVCRCLKVRSVIFHSFLNIWMLAPGLDLCCFSECVAGVICHLGALGRWGQLLCPHSEQYKRKKVESFIFLSVAVASKFNKKACANPAESGNQHIKHT